MRIAIEILGVLVVIWAVVEGLRAMGKRYAKGLDSEKSADGRVGGAGGSPPAPSKKLKKK